MFKRFMMAAAAVALVAHTATAQTSVDIELALLVDVSGSVDATEYLRQKDGYRDAFNNIGLWTDFAASGRTLAVSYIEWANNPVNRFAGLNGSGWSNGWFLISDVASAATFAGFIDGLSRATSASVGGNLTGIGRAIDFGINELDNNDFLGDKRIIDVSGDGTNNVGVSPASARDNAIAKNIQINGLAIGGVTLTNYYNSNVRTPDGFVESAATFDDFGDAIIRKIGRETGVRVPEPASLAMLGFGLFAMGVVVRRRKA